MIFEEFLRVSGEFLRRRFLVSSKLIQKFSSEFQRAAWFLKNSHWKSLALRLFRMSKNFSIFTIWFCLIHTYIKVSKSQKFSFEPKYERKYFCISALASKSEKWWNQEKHMYFMMINSIKIVFLCFYFLFRPLYRSFFHFLKLGQKYKKSLIRFFVQMKTLEFAFEIYWPLETLQDIWIGR